MTISDQQAPAAPAPSGTGSKGTRILGAVTLVAIAIGAYLALVSSPADENMGDVVRIIYIHVGVVTMAYVGCGLCVLGSAMYLWRKSQWWDITATVSAEIALVFTALTLVTGMIWGKPAWGAYWVWDARLTSTAMLALLLLGYAAVRRLPSESHVRARRSAVVGLLLFPTVIIVNRSVTWWRSLHQGSTLGLQPKIHDQMFFALMFNLLVAALIFAWLLIHRWRLEWLDQQLEGHELDEAITARRAEAHDSTAVAPAAPTMTETPASTTAGTTA